MESVETETVEKAVLTYLGGADLATAASSAGVSTEHLAHAADRYRTAGLATLTLAPFGWQQVNVEFADYAEAEGTFRDGLWPALRHRPWWFVRKTPCWRLRYLSSEETQELPDDLRAALDKMTTNGALSRWRRTDYEPETAAFGGPDGLMAANTVHAADAAGLFTFLDAHADPRYDGPGRPVASLMVLSHLMRAAGLEWNEQGDVWARVQAQRPEVAVTDQEAATLAAKAHGALAADLTALVESDSRFTALNRWATGMHTAGRHVADVIDDGALQTGPRTVLARAVIFCWNRAGFTAEQQAVWAHVSRLAILE